MGMMKVSSATQQLGHYPRKQTVNQKRKFVARMVVGKMKGLLCQVPCVTVTIQISPVTQLFAKCSVQHSLV